MKSRLIEKAQNMCNSVAFPACQSRVGCCWGCHSVSAVINTGLYIWSLSLLTWADTVCWNRMEHSCIKLCTTALCSVCIPAPFTLQLPDRRHNQCRLSLQHCLPMGDVHCGLDTPFFFAGQRAMTCTAVSSKAGRHYHSNFVLLFCDSCIDR